MVEYKLKLERGGARKYDTVRKDIDGRKKEFITYDQLVIESQQSDIDSTSEVMREVTSKQQTQAQQSKKPLRQFWVCSGSRKVVAQWQEKESNIKSMTGREAKCAR